MSKQIISKNWSVTAWDTQVPYLNLISEKGEDIQYFKGQKEQCPQTLKEHYQMFIIFKKKVTLTYFKKWNKTFHAEPAKCNEALKNYCGKKETRIEGPWEYGEYKKHGGDRKSLDKDVAVMSVKEVQEGVVNGTISFHQANQYKKFKQNFPTEIKFIKPEMFELRTWQKNLMSYLTQDPDDRHIYWCEDVVGGNGKSYLTKRIQWQYQYQCQVLTSGKTEDILFQIKEPKRIFIFDFPRSCKDAVPYRAIENIKDGRIQSGKYEGHTILMDCPHVIVFANFPFPTDKLSKDRCPENSKFNISTYQL